MGIRMLGWSNAALTALLRRSTHLAAAGVVAASGLGVRLEAHARTNAEIAEAIGQICRSDHARDRSNVSLAAHRKACDCLVRNIQSQNLSGDQMEMIVWLVRFDPARASAAPAGLTKSQRVAAEDAMAKAVGACRPDR